MKKKDWGHGRTGPMYVVRGYAGLSAQSPGPVVRTLKLNALDVVPRKWIDLRLLASYHKCEYGTRSAVIAHSRLTSDLETTDFGLKDYST